MKNISEYCLLNINSKYLWKNVYSERCYKTKMIVAKTIRLRLTNMESWILDSNDIKVVQLLRDPRAVYNSQRKSSSFKRWTDDFIFLCQMMTQDAKLADILPSNRLKNI
jgi:hypothetical protein